jgi:type II secretory pathway predicted ATPase ExeA
MFLDYFRLFEEPFGVTPDPRFLYLSRQHQEALASLVYGTESNRGFMALIAKPGMGKTSLLFRYLEDLRGKARTAFVFQTGCDSREFIRHVLLDLGIDSTGKDLPAMHELLNQVLVEEMRAGRRFVLVIDEAQNLDDKVLESVRLFSNFETPWMKLMQIVIAGQPGLAEKLSQPCMTQLRQRISLVIRVAPLNKEEISAYIDHRLWIAGCKDSKLFTPGARGLIAEYSEGIPRKINTVCFNAMSLACALRRNAIDRGTVLEVVADLDLESLIEKPPTLGGNVEEKLIRVVSAPQRPAETTERNNPWLGGWAPRLAVVGALVLAVATGVQPSDVLAVNTTGKIDDLALQQELVPQQQPANPAPVASSREQVQESVRVLQGQSLYRISVDNLGRYDPKVLTEIRNLNPWLSDPDYIRVGQKVLMPSVPMSSASTELRVSQEFYSSPREASKE